MEFDNSWQALLKPGSATSYFEPHGQTTFQVEAPKFAAINAWWLAEISRLIYKLDEAGSIAPIGSTRNKFLNPVGLQELTFIKSDIAQCALIKALPQTGADFRVLVFRGTDEVIDWVTDIRALLVDWSGPGLVHQGFRDAFESVWAEIEQSLNDDDSPLFYTGHSLGAAMATLAVARRRPRAVYTFGSPLVGNRAFADSLSNVDIYRIVNNRDIVATVPPLGLHHVGEFHFIAHDGQIIPSPNILEVALSRLKLRRTLHSLHELPGRLSEPPEFLSDHAPLNYVAHLERAI